MGSFTVPFTVLRLRTPLGMSYAAAKKRAVPYTKIVEELPTMRRETVQVVRQAVSEGRRAYVLVNNRAEGNAPMTVQALTEMLRGEVSFSIAQDHDASRTATRGFIDRSSKRRTQPGLRW
jgi:hypothetical protein